jgi:hypothetical protein
MDCGGGKDIHCFFLIAKTFAMEKEVEIFHLYILLPLRKEK